MVSSPYFEKKSRREIRKLELTDLVSYKKAERAHLLRTDFKRLYFVVRKLLHPLLLIALNIYHAIKKIHITVNGKVPKTKRPIIFSVSHIGMYDVEVVLQSIRKHAYLLSADEEAMYRTFDGGFFDMNGVIYVDPDDREDRKVALQTAIRFLEKKQSLFWTPEGIWNLNPNQIILPIHYGIIEAAIRTHAIIVPIGVEQYDKKSGIDFIVNIGSAYDPAEYLDDELTKDKKIALSERLRADMARLKFDAWEYKSRANIPSGYYDYFLAKRLKEWEYYTMEIIRQREFNPCGFIPEEDVLSCLNHINIDTHNAFLARIRFQYNQVRGA